MKKILLLLLLVAGGVSTASAGYGWYDASMTIGGVTTDPTAWSTSGDTPTDLGVVSDMTITSIAFKVWSDANDRGGANMFFRIWDGGDSPVGSNQDLWLGASTRISGDHDFSISWSGTEDLAKAVGLTLEAGKTYYIDMWAKTYGDSSDEWYNGDGANFHAQLTIINPSRSVTSGNWGTLCLPFNATITGANVYTIASKIVDGSDLKGVNLDAVEGNTVAAGKPYIFQATSSELSATCTGLYTTASADFGMMGNLSSTPVAVPEGKYVIQGNKIKKVVSGGSGVTCGQYRAYITLDKIDVAASRGVFFLGFDENETTGISSMYNEQCTMNNEVFDLQGRRIAQPTKGLYIVNGKKVNVK